MASLNLSLKFLLDACEQAYAASPILAGPFNRDGALVTPIPGGGTLLTFRGTICTGATGFLDWLNDLYANLVPRAPYPGRVHAGFADSLDDLWPKLPPLTPPLTVCGHSKGGALAVLAAMRLWRSDNRWNKDNFSVVTFAAPRCGDYQFAYGASFTAELKRFVNPDDVVPDLPSHRRGYWDVGQMIGPPPDWTPPRGKVENHELETGYRPWIQQLAKAA